MAEEEEDLVIITDAHDVDNDMDYLEMDSPEPEPLDYFAQSRGSQNNLHDHDHDIDDLSRSEDGDNDVQNENESRDRRSSYTISNQTRALMKQFQSTISELQIELGQGRDENEKLMIKNETLIIEYDSKIDELNLEIDEMQIESQQYQLRYSEINEELHELRSAAADKVSSTAENRELLIRLQNKEQNEMDLIIDFESANKHISRLKGQLRESSENTMTLQKMMIAMKKEKSSTESSMRTVMDKYDTLSKQSRFQIGSLQERLELLQRENEIYRQSLSSAEQERQDMQNDFTEATMELLHDELNEAHNDIKEDVTSLRLARVSSSDFTPPHHRLESYQSIDPDSPIPSSFVKQRYGSQTSLPDESLLATLQGAGDEYMHHSRKSSLDSRLGGQLQYDQISLKQDIKEVMNEVVARDIALIIKEEISKNDFESEALNNKMDELLKMSMDRRKKSIDLNLKQEKEEEEQGLNVMIREFEESMTQILSQQVISNLISSTKDRRAFEEKLNEKIEKLMQNVNANDGQQMNDAFSTAISNQMTVFQIALENEIGAAVESNMIHVFENNMNTKLRENIRVDINDIMTQYMNDIIPEPKPEPEPEPIAHANDDILKGQLQMNEMVSDTLDKVMCGKIDAFMDAFRKEVVPEVEAVFAQLSNESAQLSNNDDDEKANKRREREDNELVQLKGEIDALTREKYQHEQQLKNAATSKVHQVVKLQNLLDHMRNDNRLLQYKLEKYQEKFRQMKLQQKEESNINVVNKVWGYFQGNNKNNVSVAHLST